MVSLAVLRGEGARAFVPLVALAFLLVTGVLFDGGNGWQAEAFLLILALPIFYFSWKGRSVALGGLLTRPVVIAFALLVVFALLSLIPSADRFSTFAACMRYAALFLIFLAAAGMTGSVKRVVVYAAIVASALVLGGIGIWDFFASPNFGYIRLVPSFYQHNAFGGLLLIPVLLLPAFALTARNHRVTLWVVSGLLLAVFTLTFSRGSWLSLAVGLGASALLFPALARDVLLRQWRVLAVMVLGVGVLVAGALTLEARLAASSGTHIQVWSGETAGQNAATARLHYFKDAATVITKNPVLGVGLAHYGEAVKRYKETPAYYAASPHNAYLQFAAETGVLGGALFAAFILLVLLSIWRMRRTITAGDEGVLAAALSAGFVAIAFHSGMEIDWVYGANALLYVVAAGLLVSLAAPPRAPNERLGSFWFGALSLLALVLLVWGTVVALAGAASGRGYAAASRDDFAGAAIAFTDAARYLPFDPAHHFNAAVALDHLAAVTEEPAEKGADLLAATMEIDKALALKPRKPLFHSWKALLLMERGDAAGAERAYADTIRYNPIEALYEYTQLANLYIGQKRYDDVIALLPRVLAAYPPALYDNPYWVNPDKLLVWEQVGSLWLALGVAYRETGRGEDARHALEQALIYDPDNAGVKASLKSL